MHDAHNVTNRFVSGFRELNRHEKPVEDPLLQLHSHVRKAPRSKKKRKKEKRKKGKKRNKCALENSGISDPGRKKTKKK